MSNFRKLTRLLLIVVGKSQFKPRFSINHNDPCNYHINCKEISLDTVIQLLDDSNGNTTDGKNEYIFHYQQQFNNRIYRVSCEIASSLILNRCIYGIEIEQNFVHN